MKITLYMSRKKTEKDSFRNAKILKNGYTMKEQMLAIRYTRQSIMSFSLNTQRTKIGKSRKS